MIDGMMTDVELADVKALLERQFSIEVTGIAYVGRGLSPSGGRSLDETRLVKVDWRSGQQAGWQLVEVI